jgi:prevent-host-death family protein
MPTGTTGSTQTVNPVITGREEEMRTREKVTAIMRDVEQNAAEYTFTRKGAPVAVVVPHEKLAALRAELADR